MNLSAWLFCIALMGALWSQGAQSREGALDYRTLLRDMDLTALKVRAEGGDVEAKFLLGHATAHRTLNREGRALWEEAAKQGHVESMYALATAVADLQRMQDPGVPAEQAIYWFRRAADHGHIDAMRALGRAYLDQPGMPRDIPEGLHWLEMAAERGSSEAMYSLSMAYAEDRIMPRNEALAIRWYARADEARKVEQAQNATPDDPRDLKTLTSDAKAGDRDAAFLLARRYQTGQGVNADLGKARKWYLEAVGGLEKHRYHYKKLLEYVPPKQGSAEALYQMGVMYRSATESKSRRALNCTKDKKGGLVNYSECRKIAEALFRAAAEKGHSEAMLALTTLHTMPGGGNFHGGVEALYRTAARLGNREGLRRLAEHYRLDRYGPTKTPANPAEFAFWSRMAKDEEPQQTGTAEGEQMAAALRTRAEAGDVDAMVALARLYDKGNGVNRSAFTALYWFEMAASAGHSAAMIETVRRHELALGTSPNAATLKLWKDRQKSNDVIAAQNGNAAAMKRLGGPWLNTLAKQGDPEALYRLGLDAETGWSPNAERAKQWYRQASAAGHREAAQRLAQLEGREQYLSEQAELQSQRNQASYERLQEARARMDAATRAEWRTENATEQRERHQRELREYREELDARFGK